MVVPEALFDTHNLRAGLDEPLSINDLQAPPERATRCPCCCRLSRFLSSCRARLALPPLVSGSGNLRFSMLIQAHNTKEVHALALRDAAL